MFQRKIEEKGMSSIKADYELYVKNIKEKKVFENPNKKSKGDNSMDFEKSNPLELDLKENVAKEGKEEDKKKKLIKIEDSDLMRKLDGLERIMKMNGIFLLILITALFLMIIMMNTSLKNINTRLDWLEEEIKKKEEL